MNVAKSMRHCMRLLRQRVTTKVLQNLQALAVRNYRSDDYDGYGWRGAEDNNSYQPSGKMGMQDTESRRRHFTQGIEDHRRRQSQIIMDNKRRWEQRSVPKSPILHNYAEDVYARQNKGKPRHNKQDNQEAEKYSRRRRHQRQKEVKRQERELRESRKGYKLPKAEMQELEYHQEEEEEHTPRTPKTRATNEREWMEHQRREEEQKYWHSWHSCPNQRRNKIITLNEDEEPSGTGYSNPSDGKFTWPKLPHDGSVRRYQTSSQQRAAQTPPIAPPIAPPNSQKVTTHKRRRPSSMDKQMYSKNKHALPQPIFKRLEKKQKTQKQKKLKARKSVQPPRYTPQYTPKSKRPSTPGDSFSNMLALNTRDTPHSEYTGYLRQTVGDIWKNFIANHKARPTSSQKHA